MKLNIRIYSTILAVIFIAALFYGCKKKKAFDEEDAQDAVENRFVQGACDEVLKDVNTVIMEQFLLRGKNSGLKGNETSTTSVCGVTLDTTKITSGIITIKYGGSACSGWKRSGSVKFTIKNYPITKWKHVGSVINIDFIDYKVIHLSDVKNIKINGTVFLTNETGNTWFELAYLNEPSVTYRMTGTDLKVVYNDGNYGKINFDRRLTFTYTDKVFTCLVQGATTAYDRSNAENWGLSQRGQNFVSQVQSPYTWRTSCGPAVVLRGEVAIKVNDKEFDLNCEYGVSKYGDSQNGVDVPCPYGFKVRWSRKNKTNSRIFSYF